MIRDKRIQELERKLRHKEDEVSRLKQERDRLVDISNELKADLQSSQKLVMQYKDSLETDGPDYSREGKVIRANRFNEFEDEPENKRMTGCSEYYRSFDLYKSRLDKLDDYAEELADEVKEWMRD